MRIGLFTDTFTPDINGVVTSIETLRKQLIRDGHDVFVITNHPKLLQYSYQDRILRVTGVEVKFLYGYTISTPWHLRAYNEIKKMRLDIIHVHTEFGIGIFARICASRLNIPLVSTYHTTYEDYTHYVNVFDSKIVEKYSKKAVASLSKVYSQSSSIVIAPSEKTKELLESYKITKEIEVIPSGLDLSAFAHPDPKLRAQRRAEFGYTDADIVLVYIGRIAQEKSLDVVLEVFASLTQRNNAVKLLIIGGGPSLDDLKKQAADLQISEKVTFAGKRVAQDVPSYYFASDLFISASLTETQGVTFIEALASGLPVFARPDEPYIDIVHEDETGFYFNSPEEFTAKVTYYLDKSVAEKDRFRQACISIVEPFSSEAFADHVLKVYQRAVDFAQDVSSITHVEITDDECVIFYENQHQTNRIILSRQSYDDSFKEGKALSTKELEALLKQQDIYFAYLKAIKKLGYKDYSLYEMRLYLLDKEMLKQPDAEFIIQELKQRHFLDDSRYMDELIQSGIDKGYGSIRIRESLSRHYFDDQAMELKLQQLDHNSELSRAKDVAERYLLTLHTQSRSEKVSKVKIKLSRMGYEHFDIDRVVSMIDFEIQGSSEEDALVLCLQKARRIYQHKPLQDQHQLIIQYAYRKGFNYDAIKKQMDEMEQDNEED